MQQVLSILEKQQPKLQMAGSHCRAVLQVLLTLLRGDVLSAAQLCKDVKLVQDVHQVGKETSVHSKLLFGESTNPSIMRSGNMCKYYIVSYIVYIVQTYL